MKRFTTFLATVLALLTIVSHQTSVVAKETWISVRSRNFLVLGNGSQKDIRQVAARLEQFRDVISRMFTKINISSPVPTTVVVFKSEGSYRPFKVNANNAGYFQAGADVNYITLTTETRGDQDPFSIIFHEFTHLLVNNTIGNAPAWFNEGLAEYYSTFSITDDQKVVLGRPIASHVFLLRQNRMLPLRTLFQVDHKSPYYNERDKQSIFYAQSWALMHYLILNKNDQRVAQMSKFLDLLTGKVPIEHAFQQAFQTTFEAMEKDLREYVRQDRYRVMQGHFEHKLQTDTEMQTAPVSEAEAQAYLGDLLLHSNRAEAESYLQRALTLDPNLAMAHASLGVLRFRQGKPQEARASLERAVTSSSQNYLIHYYYAYVLGRPAQDDVQLGSGYSQETAAKIRAELKKAIALRPDFPESYNLLAFVNLVTNTEIDEAIAMLKRALAVSPGRADFNYMLGQLYMNKDDYKSARPLLEQVVASDLNDRTRRHAERLLETIVAIEEQRARREALRKGGGSSDRSTQTSAGDVDTTSSGVEPAPTDPSSLLREVLRTPAAGETQLQGTLVRIDCEPKGLVFVVKIGERLLRLRTDSFEKVEITTYNPEIKGEISCGARTPENPVVVCYSAMTDKRVKADGVLSSIEFVPGDFKLKPQP